MLTGHLKEQSIHSLKSSQHNSFKFLMKNEPWESEKDSLILLRLGHAQVLKWSELLPQVYLVHSKVFRFDKKNHRLLCWLKLIHHIEIICNSGLILKLLLSNLLKSVKVFLQSWKTNLWALSWSPLIPSLWFKELQSKEGVRSCFWFQFQKHNRLTFCK